VAERNAHSRLTEALEAIASCETQVRAFVEYDQNAVDEVTADHRGPLSGVVVGVKDVIDVAGFPTRFGSAAFASAKPATTDATVVRRLREAGGMILGKLKTTEFAYTDPTDTDNPAAPGHTPGGSSSGSAAAVAAGMVDLSLGTQTVGSVCRPAAYCGVAAFKPSTGSLPLKGVAPLAPDFDTVGTMAHNMALAVSGWQVCSGLKGTPLPAVSLKGLRVGILADPLFQAVSPAVKHALSYVADILETEGARIVKLSTDVDHEALRVDHRVVMFKSVARHHEDLLAQSESLGANWRYAIETGSKLSSAECACALDRLRDRRARLQALASSVDILMLPPVADVAPKGHASTGDAGLIVSWTVMGGPISVIPVPQKQSQLPTAVMLTALPGSDTKLGALSIIVEQLIANRTADEGIGLKPA